MLYKIFIDGESGTTGLEIKQRLSTHCGVEVISIDQSLQKNTNERLKMFDKADLVFLCLPDSSAKSIMEEVDTDTGVIDASTAHRVDANWVYGLPELCRGQRDKIRSSNRVANPGCHATGFILLIRPLVDAGYLSENALLNFHSLTGYSGGGKTMINSYEKAEYPADNLRAPRHYALTQMHKHLPEMQIQSGITTPPLFSPIVGNFYRGMHVTVPLHSRILKKKTAPDELMDFYRARYKNDSLISVKNVEDVFCEGFVNADGMAGNNGMEITVCGNSERMMLMARYDNLGKGASGAAIQNMNIMLGFPESDGLQIKKDSE